MFRKSRLTKHSTGNPFLEGNLLI